MYATSTIQSFEHPMVVVDHSPATARALKMACPECVVHTHRSATAAQKALEQQPALLICDLDTPGVQELYHQASTHLKRRFIFVCDTRSTQHRAFLRKIGNPPLLYKPLSPMLIQTLIASAAASAAASA